MTDYQALFNELQLPKQNLQKLTFCGIKPRQFQTWLEDLATKDNGQSSIIFYKLIPEINQLDISASQRLSLLCLARPYVYRCVNRLAEDFSSYPLSLTEKMTKLAAIAQAIQRHLSDGFILCASQLMADSQSKDFSNIILNELSISLYYATHGLGQIFYRNCQLYIPRPPMLWRKLHSLYLIARNHKIEHNSMVDDLLHARKSMTIEQSYLQTLLLDASQANQLRQIDIHYLYSAHENWASKVNLIPADKANNCLYWIDLDADDGCSYQSRFHNPESSSLFGLNLDNLIGFIKNYHPQVVNSNIEDIPVQIRQSILAHLLSNWKQEHSRQLSRKQANIKLEVFVGLKDAHQTLLDGLSFANFLDQTNQNEKDRFDIDGLLKPQTQPANDNGSNGGELSIVTATDISDSGYCLRWEGAAPTQIKFGEILLLKHPKTDEWQVGTIRWAQRLNSFMYAGVLILSEHPKASAASTTLKDGNATPFFRTLILNDKKGKASHSSLITPNIPFTEEQEIQLQIDSMCHKARLSQLLLSAGSVSQFSYKQLKSD